MKTYSPWTSHIDLDVFHRMLDSMGLNSPTPVMMNASFDLREVIDVNATDSDTHRSTSRNVFRKAARSVGAAAGYAQRAATKTIDTLFHNPTAKRSALLAHWTFWSMIMTVIIASSATFGMALFFTVMYLYITVIIFDAILSIN